MEKLARDEAPDGDDMSEPNGTLRWTDRETGELKEASVFVMWHYPPQREGGGHEIGMSRVVDSVAVIGEAEESHVLKREISRAQRSLHEKNLALDASYYVWCSGGCQTGILRWQEEHSAPPLTEEIVREAERQTKRLRQWLESGREKRRRGYPSAPGAEKLEVGE